MLRTPSTLFKIPVLLFWNLCKVSAGKELRLYISLWITLGEKNPKPVAFLLWCKDCLCSPCFHHCGFSTWQLALISSGPHAVPCDLNIFTRRKRPRSKLTKCVQCVNSGLSGPEINQEIKWRVKKTVSLWELIEVNFFQIHSSGPD